MYVFLLLSFRSFGVGPMFPHGKLPTFSTPFLETYTIYILTILIVTSFGYISIAVTTKLWDQKKLGIA